MHVTLNIPDNLPKDMVQNYLHSIEQQMQLMSDLLSKHNNNATELRTLFKETQKIAELNSLSDADITQDY